MKPGTHFKRRGFIGAALVGLGGSLGWLFRKSQTPGDVRTASTPTLGSRFTYDISEFEQTDPALLRHQPGSQFPTGFNRVTRLTAAPKDRVWVAGDRSVKLFDPMGGLEQEIHLDRPPHCLFVSAEEELVIGLGNFFEVYDSKNKRRLRSPRLGENSFLTALAAHRAHVFLADAGNREVVVCNRESGAVIERFGKKDPARNNPGFAIPSPYFDLAVAPDGRLRVVNPGWLRVETYSPDGRFESSWGEPGMQIDRFCGCCNPVYFTLTHQGDFITSEKGLARINIYNANGQFQGAVAGPETLVEDKQLARRACVDCRTGAGFDVTTDSRGRVLALDPFRKVVRIFEPLPQTEFNT